MPKLYEYFGVVVFFYSNEHLPIRVHGRAENRELKASFVIIEGVIVAIQFTAVKGKPVLRPAEERRFRQVVEANQADIVQKWVDFFVHHKDIQSIRITRELDS